MRTNARFEILSDPPSSVGTLQLARNMASMVRDSLVFIICRDSADEQWCHVACVVSSSLRAQEIGKPGETVPISAVHAVKVAIAPFGGSGGGHPGAATGNFRAVPGQEWAALQYAVDHFAGYLAVGLG